MLAVTWIPELRGILTVIIAVVALCGSIYLILSTNMGARLGFQVVLAALFGWMFIMGAIWWTYGKGLLGTAPSWKPVPGATVLQEPIALTQAGALDAPVVVTGNIAGDTQTVQDELVKEHWTKLDNALPSYQQAGAAGTVFLEESGALKAGEFQVVNVYDRGGQSTPKLFDGKVDFIAFFHKPYYSVVEIAPVIAQRDEPGRAPAKAVIDTTRPHQYVYMIRDLGTLRKPAGYITIGSLLIFLNLCWMLHRRDRTVAINRAAKALPVGTSA